MPNIIVTGFPGSGFVPAYNGASFDRMNKGFPRDQRQENWRIQWAKAARMPFVEGLTAVKKLEFRGSKVMPRRPDPEPVALWPHQVAWVSLRLTHEPDATNTSHSALFSRARCPCHATTQPAPKTRIPLPQRAASDTITANALSPGPCCLTSGIHVHTKRQSNPSRLRCGPITWHGSAFG